MGMGDPRPLDFEADVSELTQGDPAEALLPLLRQLSGWEEVDADAVSTVQIAGAMTNVIFRVQNLCTSEFVLVRVFGEADALFSRSDEQCIFAAVARAGLGPRLLARFCNGRVEEFLLDQSISAAEMRAPPVALCVAAAMASFHFSELAAATGAAAGAAIVWPRLRAWARALAGLYSPAELAELRVAAVLSEVDALEAALSGGAAALLGFCHNDLQYGNMLLHTSAPRSLSGGRPGRAAAHAVAMADRAVRGGSPPARCGSYGSAWGGSPRGWSPEPAGASPRRGAPRGRQRGFSPGELEPSTSAGELVSDLLEGAAAELGAGPGSSAGSSDAGDAPGGRGRRPFRARLSVRLIDYEYAGVNPVAFDIANNWCEYAADYHADPPHALDYSLLPDRAHQERFVRAYLQAAEALREGAPGGAVAAGSAGGALAAGAEALRTAAEAFLPVSHLLWGLWGLIQARVSQLPDFDFTAYAQQRLEQYRLCTAAWHVPG